MPSKDYTLDLLGLKDVSITKNETTGEEKHIYLDCELQPQVCLHCHMSTKCVHLYITQIVKDLPGFDKYTILHIRKRRYFCPHCGGTFLEKLSFLKKYQRCTQRLQFKILKDFQEVYSTKSIAKMNNVSSGVATRIFNHVQFPKPKLSRILSIDKFKGNAGRKFQCILTDPVARNVLHILPWKLTTELEQYFLSFPKAEHEKA